MNSYIKQQLNLIKVADLPPWDDNTTLISISKKQSVELIMQENHYYLIELEDYILNPPEGFSLHTNWNNGNIPKYKYMKCLCVKAMGKMVKILGVGFDYEHRQDLDENWDGWLPLKSIKILREI